MRLIRNQTERTGTDEGQGIAVLTFMQEHHIEEGSSVQLIQRCMHGVIIKVQGHCFAIGDEIADQIKV